MSMDVERLVRDALEEPAPPPPPEPVEDEDDDDGGHHACPQATLVMFADGSLSAQRGGVVLLAWLGIATGVTVVAALQTLAAVVGALTAVLGVLLLGCVAASAPTTLTWKRRAVWVALVAVLAAVLGWTVAWGWTR